jgi:hypothetical protein
MIIVAQLTLDGRLHGKNTFCLIQNGQQSVFRMNSMKYGLIPRSHEFFRLWSYDIHRFKTEVERSKLVYNI